MAKKRKTELDIDISEDDAPAEEEAPPPPPPAEGEEAPQEGKEEEGAKKPSRVPILKILLIVIPVILLLAGGVIYFSMSKAKKAKALEEQRLKEEELKKKAELIAKVPKVPIFALDPFFVSLKEKKEGGAGKFLTIKMSMEMSSDKISKELSKSLASIRESIFFYLSEKPYSEMTGAKNMALLESDIRLIINQNLQTGSVKKIFFTEFIIQ